MGKKLEINAMLCEGVREGKDGRFDLFGAMVDEIGVAEFPTTIPTLCLFAVIKGNEQEALSINSVKFSTPGNEKPKEFKDLRFKRISGSEKLDNAIVECVLKIRNARITEPGNLDVGIRFGNRYRHVASATFVQRLD